MIAQAAKINSEKRLQLSHLKIMLNLDHHQHRFHISVIKVNEDQYSTQLIVKVIVISIIEKKTIRPIVLKWLLNLRGTVSEQELPQLSRIHQPERKQI